ncbi:hypothetical protein [Alteromonas sp. a30]|uniref:hypothetical protein n=1 Tax=Alteromonas sp. a30 TaxID=2730917 RepID=UPI00227EAE12|nr:hypothetical protein [Alteromonas sp. a30]MCY7296522.1 hypothetical protein [Alteromonas sp. a30]
MATMANQNRQSVKRILEFNGAGQLQNQRALPALKGSIFSVEQRDFVDWIAYLRHVGAKLRFFDPDSMGFNGTWREALPNDDEAKALARLMRGESVSPRIKSLASRADISSLMAYYHMLRYPIAQFQRFTEHHLDYYYRDVLGFQPKSAQPDRAHIVVNIAEDAKPVTLIKGAQFDGGKDAQGNALVYETLSNAQFNHAQVARVLSISRLTEGGRLLLTNAVDSEAGADMPENGILSFGEKWQVQPNADLDERQSEPDQGIEMTSSAFYLAGGDRDITLNFTVSESVQLPAPLAELFDLFISTEEGFIALTETTENAEITWENNQLRIQLGRLFAPITAPAQEVEAEAIGTQLPQPGVRLLLKKSWLDVDATGNLRRGVFEKITLAVSVKRLPQSKIGQAGGVLDSKAPFTPFGASPRIASRFDFTHPELLCKPIFCASVNFDWLDRPEDWNTYYHAYRVYQNQNTPNTPDEPNTTDEPDTPLPDVGPFKVSVFYSDKNGAVLLPEETRLFSDAAPVDNIDKHSFEFIHDPQQAVASFNALPLEENQPTLWPKYFSLQLEAPDFGHQMHFSVSQFAALNNSRRISEADFQPLIALPPYTPLLDNFTIDYQTHAVFSAQQAENLDMKHIHPLGISPVTTVAGRFSALPRLDLRGYLYIGVSQVQLPGQVRLYFQLDPVDGSNIVDAPRIDWHYLTDDGWQYFDSSNDGSARITEDSTFQLLDSGIITFDLPELNYRNNFIDGSKLWIRIGIAPSAIIDNENHARYSRIRNIYAQGVEVQLASGDIAASHYNQPLPELSINGMLQGPADVTEVMQPYPSFGAKPSEPQASLKVRASERLRHKDRALLAWDYERLVLAKFPELYLTRCFSVSQEHQPPVALVVVPINHNPNILQPKVPLYLKRQIQRFVDEVSPEGVEVAVRDPIYEEVRVTVYAQIKPEFDKERIEVEINQMLIESMTPWNKTTLNPQDGLRGNVELTFLAQQMEQHPALERVYVVRARQSTEQGPVLYPGSGQGDNKFVQDNVIRTSSPQSILVPAKVHDINLFNHYQPVFEGIGKWRLELDFKVR